VAEFTATPEDLSEVINLKIRETLRRGALYPAVAILIAIVSWWFLPMVAVFSAGAASAWIYGLGIEIRGLRAGYLWRYAWLQEGVTLRVGDDGIEWSTARGVALTRWNDELIVRRLGTCFVLEDEGEDVAVIPRKYLDATELILLDNRSAERAGSESA
jgi:hypothetical protein